jgi:hypothetical protein
MNTDLIDMASTAVVAAPAVGAVAANGHELLLVPEHELLADPECEHCGKPFAPRKGSGGRTQKFCSSACRSAFHAAPTSPSTSPTSKTLAPNVGKSSGDVREVVAGVGNVVAAVGPQLDDDSEEFRWADDIVVIPSQPAIAVYFNPRGEIVIRQEGQYHPYEDQWVYVQVQNLQPLIDTLLRIARREIVPA